MKNEFKMSLFAAPISPVKDSLTGRVSRPATVYPSREVTLQEVARLITGDPALERLTRQLRLPLETGDKERFSELKRQTDWTLPRRRKLSEDSCSTMPTYAPLSASSARANEA